MVRMFFEVLPVSCLAGVLYAVFRRMRIKKAGLACRPGQEVLRVLFVCYLTGLAGLVLVPNNFWTNLWFYLKNGYAGCQVGPLFSGSIQLRSALLGVLTGERTAGSWVLRMLLGNFLMFVPMGVFLSLLRTKAQGRSVLAAALLIPAAAEAVQPILGRSFDVDDLVLNTAGILAGYGIAAVFRRLYQR